MLSAPYDGSHLWKFSLLDWKKCFTSISAKTSKKSGAETSGCDIQEPSEALKKIASSKSYTVVDVPGDGNCAIHAIIDQLKQYSPNVLSLNVVPDVQTVRKMAVEYLRSNPEMLPENASFWNIIIRVAMTTLINRVRMNGAMNWCWEQ